MKIGSNFIPSRINDDIIYEQNKLPRPQVRTTYISNIKLHFGFCSGIVNTGDRVAEPSCSGIERKGADVNENQFRLTIDGIVALAILGLPAFYHSSPENKAKVIAALSNALERGGDKIGDITSGSLVVVLHCSSSKRFLRFWDDYLVGSVKRRLSKEFSKIGIEEITVQIENEEEVIEKSEVIR